PLQREDIVAPERSVVPVLAIVPLQQEAPGPLFGRDMDVGKQAIALADGMAAWVGMEPVSVCPLGGGLGMGVLAADTFRLPGAVGHRSGRRAVSEPLVFGLFVGRNQAFSRLQQLDLAAGDLAARGDRDAHLAALGASHAAGLLLAAGRLV